MTERPDQDAGHLLMVIDSVWQKTEQRWHDDMASHFDRAHWTPLLAESRAGGTEVIDGGEFLDADPSEGNYMKPALVLDPSATERIVTEEQFGPALPVMPYDDEAEVALGKREIGAGGESTDDWNFGLCGAQ